MVIATINDENFYCKSGELETIKRTRTVPNPAAVCQPHCEPRNRETSKLEASTIFAVPPSVSPSRFDRSVS